MTPTLSPGDAKRFATLQARAALFGITLHCLEGDRQPVVYIATKWALTREFQDFGSVETWIANVTGERRG